MMKPEEVKAAHESKTSVTAMHKGQQHTGTIREFGLMSFPIGNGILNRAIAIIDNGVDGEDFPAFYRDLSLAQQ